MELPEKGLSKSDIKKKLSTYRGDDIDWSSGRAFGYVFDPGDDLVQFAKEVYMDFLSESGLDFTVYPSLLRFENDIVSMMRKHLGGDQNTVGHFTSGGTESILLAVKTARDYARKVKPGVSEPEMVLPVTAHAAFHKAAHYFCVKPVTVSVNGDTFKADPASIEEAITENTILIVGSAPSYTHGVVDPIPELAEIASRHNILFHTDACMGGFLLPYFRRLGGEFPDFDFSVPGVTSLSVDLHKYAYTPKGASMILYRDPSLRREQVFTCAEWIGYTMINPTTQSTKSGGPLAAAWAVLNRVGDDGYLEFARRKKEAVEGYVRGITSIPELRLMAHPDMTLISFTSDEVNIFHIIDEMNIRGWYIQPSLKYDNCPENIHLSINLSNVDKVDAFTENLKESVNAAKELPSGTLLEQIGKLLEEKVDEIFSNPEELMALAGIKGDTIPERFAPVNEVLNFLSPEMRERMLLDFATTMFHPAD